MQKELNLETATPKEYRLWLKTQVSEGKLPKSELDLIHVRQENRLFDPKTGRKLSAPSIQKYNIREWGTDPNEKQWDYYERMRTSDGGYDYAIMYNPRDNEVDGDETATEDKPRKGKAEKETISLGE